MANGQHLEGYNEARRMLETILREHGGGSYTLPPLREAPSLLERFIDLRQIKEFINNLLRSLTGGSSASAEALVNLMPLLIKLGIVLLCLFVALKIYRYALRKLGSAAQGSPLPGSKSPKISSIDDLLSRNIAQGDWAQALRLRWLLFLIRNEFPLNLTLSEYAAQREPKFPWAEMYRTMFGRQVPDSADFSRFDAHLSLREKQPA